MQHTHIPLWRTFLNWIIAVLAGSFFWPLFTQFFEGMGGDFNDIDGIAGIMLISAILSAMTSLPAMLLLLLTNWLLNRKQLIRAAYLRIHIAVHLLVAILTFLVIYVFVGEGLGRKDGFAFVMIAITYTLAGLTTWSITFTIYRKREKEGIHHDDLLDEEL